MSEEEQRLLVLDIKAKDKELWDKVEIDPQAPSFTTVYGLNGAVSGYVAFTEADADRLIAAGKMPVIALVEDWPGLAPTQMETPTMTPSFLTKVEGVVVDDMVAHSLPRAANYQKPVLIGKADGRFHASIGRLEYYCPQLKLTLKAGDPITIDGRNATLYAAKLPVQSYTLTGEDRQLALNADKTRNIYEGLRIKASIGYEEELHNAMSFGAEAIGLFRSEVEVKNVTRTQAAFQRALLASVLFFSAPKGVEYKKRIIKELYHFQTACCEYSINPTYPITMRLFDIQPRTIFSDIGALTDDTIGSLCKNGADRAAIRKSIEELRNDNLHGASLLTHPNYSDICQAQIEGIFYSAAIAKKRTAFLNYEFELTDPTDVLQTSRQKRLKLAQEYYCEDLEKDIAHPPYEPPIEILIPNVSNADEIRIAREMVEEMAKKYGLEEREYKLGAMVETPDACKHMREIAPLCDFISFGTNDLTSAVIGVARDDSDAMRKWADDNHSEKTPDRTLVEPVKDIIIKTLQVAREANPTIETGLCGNQVSGDLDSIQFCHDAGMDFISVATNEKMLWFARVAAGQMALKSPRLEQNKKTGFVGKLLKQSIKPDTLNLSDGRTPSIS